MQNGSYSVINLSAQVLGQPGDEVMVSHNLPPQLSVLPSHLNQLPPDCPLILHQLHGPVIERVALKRQSQLVN